MRTRTALAGVAAGAVWLSFASDARPARVAVGAVLALLPAVAVAGHLRAAGHRARLGAVLAAAAAAATVLLVEVAGARLGAEGGPALVAVVLALWTAVLLRRPATARRPRSVPVAPLRPVPGTPARPAPTVERVPPARCPDAVPSAPAPPPGSAVQLPHAG